MQRWRGLDSTPSNWGRCVVTIGVFDGVHRGHQQIIGRAVERARAGGHSSVLLTFDPHPSEVVRPGSHPPILTTQRTKAALVEQLGVDVFCVVPFTPDFMRLPPDEFVHEVLVSSLHASGVVVGANFRYGRKAAGDVEALTRAGRSFGFTVEGVPLLEEEDGTSISSTYIRSCIAGGDVVAAAKALGRPHRIEGVVVRGDARGASIGYPTANLATVAYAAVPADGVYAGRMQRGDQALPMAISIGTNPTFEGQERRIEGYVLDFDGDLYGEHVTFEFVERLRSTERYDTVEALVEQMGRDVEETRRLSA
ncbi:MAG TPA: bifunctional riboflavin kinase/FAD synthetase [Frankiaceae bacterium]|nr:bifunctional riboflavin kinase/FAD synthetase [Frankiaceae bacterium]